MPGDAGSDIQDWFKSIPLFTRCWFGGSVIFSLIGRFRLVHPYWFIITWESFVTKFQIWRPITALLYYHVPGTRYQVSFHWLIILYWLYSYSKRLETGVFDGRPADYLFMLLFNLTLSTMTSLFLNIIIMMDQMVLSVVYVWCMINKDTIVNFWFGAQFKAMYLPWVWFAISLIINREGIVELVGILIGHMYFFLSFKYPQDFGGPSLLATPNILYSWFPNKRGSSGYGQAPASDQQGGDNGGQGGQGGGGFQRPHAWGGGQRLGN